MTSIGKTQGSTIMSSHIYQWFLVFALCFGFYFSFLDKVEAAVTLQKPQNYTGLAGYFTFDGGDINWTTSAVTNRAGGTNGLLVNVSTTSAPLPGKRGQALDFDASDDAVSISTDFIATGADSVCAWIFPKTLGENSLGTIVDNSQTILQLVSSTGNKVRFSSDAGVTNADSAAITLNQWSHVCATRISAGTANLYVNGALSGSADQSSGTPVAGSTVFLGNRSAGDRTFDGRIDDVRVYSRVLTLSQITALYNSGVAKLSSSFNTRLTSGLVGLWSFDGKDLDWATGVAYNRAGSQNGTILNMSTSTALVPGKIGQALKFDGKDDRIKVTTFTPDMSSGGTISFWLSDQQPATTSAAATLLITGLFSGASAAFSINHTNPNGVIRIFVDDSTVGGTQAYDKTLPVGTIATSTWTHLAITYNTTILTVYKDGVSIATDDPAGSGLGTPANLFIGASIFSFGHHPFIMDELRIYNRALSSPEVTLLYNMGKVKIDSTALDGQYAEP